MGYFQDGQWRTGWYPSDTSGRFLRPPTTFRQQLQTEDIAPNRYHLYVSLACPWAHRTLIARELLALQDYLSVSVVDWYLDDDGWAFREREGATRDSVLGHDFLRQVYLSAESNYSGRVTVPVLWDKEGQRIVNNESREILRLMSRVFAPFGNGRDLLASEPPERIDEILDAIYEPINNGVYKAGFAQSQEAYQEAVDTLFAELDRWDRVLGSREYLAGESITEADICMFTTLIRFDPVYFVHFKCSKQRIADYKNLSRYLTQLYEIPEFRTTVNMTHIRHHYFESHRTVNPFGLVAAATRGTVGL